MANHKSALKRIRSDESKRSLNKLQHKTARNAIKKLKEVWINQNFVIDKKKIKEILKF